MDSNFRCFVTFNDNNYEIVINDDISSVCFEDIYQKIKAIFKMISMDEISFETHLFEIIKENNASKSEVIERLDCFIKHETVISISPKVQFYDFRNYEEVNYNESEILDINNTQSYIPHEYYCDVCPVLTDRASDPRLNKFKLNLNFDSYKRYSDMFRVISQICDNRCDSISDYYWLNVIPYQMRAFGYKNFDPKNWKNCFQYFFKSYIQILEKAPNYSTACSLFPFLHEFNAMIFDTKNQFYEQIIKLKAIMNKNSLNNEINDDEIEENELVMEMEKKAKDIKGFHLMVQLVYMNGVPKGKKRYRTRQWERISDLMMKYGYKDWTSGKCYDQMHDWAKFYAENFKELSELKLSSSTSKLFDLLKVLHTIDLTDIFMKSDPKMQKIMSFGESDEIRNYLLNAYLNEKEMLSEIIGKSDYGLSQKSSQTYSYELKEKRKRRLKSFIGKCSTSLQSDNCVPMEMDLDSEQTNDSQISNTSQVIVDKQNNGSVDTNVCQAMSRDPRLRKRKKEDQIQSNQCLPQNSCNETIDISENVNMNKDVVLNSGECVHQNCDKEGKMSTSVTDVKEEVICDDKCRIQSLTNTSIIRDPRLRKLLENKKIDNQSESQNKQIKIETIDLTEF